MHTTQLHAHLTGSISRECLHDIWVARKAANATFELEDPLVAIPTGKVDYDIKTYDVFSMPGSSQCVCQTENDYGVFSERCFDDSCVLMTVS
jgi:hypothetical protein